MEFVTPTNTYRQRRLLFFFVAVNLHMLSGPWQCTIFFYTGHFIILQTAERSNMLSTYSVIVYLLIYERNKSYMVTEFGEPLSIDAQAIDVPCMLMGNCL